MKRPATPSPRERKTLHFPTLIELIDFEVNIDRPDLEVNRQSRNISGRFTPAEVDLARNRFAALEIR
jgi:hypothetical protein